MRNVLSLLSLDRKNNDPDFFMKAEYLLTAMLTQYKLLNGDETTIKKEIRCFDYLFRASQFTGNHHVYKMRHIPCE